MFYQKLAIFVLSLSTCPIAWAHTPERGKVMGTFGPLIQQTIPIGEEYGARSPLQVGFGIIAEGDLDKNGGLEIGIFYQQKLFFAEQLGQSLVEKIRLVTITTGYRHWFTKNFSFAGAFFSSYTVGEAEVVHKNYSAPSNLTTSARDVTEYGFDFSLQWEIWGDEKRGVVLDTRYTQSVTEKDYESANHYTLLLGFKHSVYVK